VPNVGIEMRQRQRLALTPRLQQSVRLLQLSALEFAQEVQQALTNNPFLEDNEEDGEDGGAAAAALADGMKDATAPADQPPDTAAADAEAAAAPDEPIGSTDGYDRPSSGSRDDHEGDWTEWTESQPTLRDHLHGQLRMCQLEPRDRALCQHLIEALDDDGYLRQSFEEIGRLLPSELGIEDAEWLTVLRLIQSMEPCGVGARDLRECMLLQIDSREDDGPANALARRVVSEHLNLLARREFQRIQKLENVTEDEMKAAYAIIRRLDPRPGWRFGRPDFRYIVPDVIVRKIKGKWVTSINPAVLPRVRLNRTYAELFQANREATHHQLAGQLQEARWLVRNTEQRFVTILRVAEAIVAKQKAFLEYGELAMKPLGLRHIARELNLHDSTVSRVTNNKYMATPRGLFEFRHFFSRELATETGGACSATAIRALLKEMIGAEEREAPFSDAQLADLLGKQGVKVARRTVTKYRRLLQLPSVELRRMSALPES
jgi:RNA polymerase sigma-54 factor